MYRTYEQLMTIAKTSLHCILKDEKSSMILIEKLQKYQQYHQTKLISVNISQVKKHYLLINNK